MIERYVKRIDRYIIKKYLGTFFLAIALIISISIIFDVSENIDDFITKKAPVKAIIFDYYLNFIPYFYKSLQRPFHIHCRHLLYIKNGL